tara:strand:- start:399 stop:899 length:501 start_codon:yes stop_codon:yes gene_type:complete
MAVYVVDSNFFIQAHRVNYPLDIAHSFWNKVKELADAGRIISIDKVKDELYDKNDDLEVWCKANLPEDFFKSTDGVMTEYGIVTAWAISMNQHYLPNALNEFLDADEADAFLVAYSLADKDNRVLVTQEKSQPNRKNKIKIPEACDPINVRFLNTIEMFRELGTTF